MRALCEFSLLVSQQTQSDLSLTALHDALKRFYKNEDAFRNQTMLKSGKAIVEKQLTREPDQLRQQNIHQMHTSMEVPVYGPEKFTPTKRREFQVHQNRAHLTATKWSDADCQSGNERLEHDIHQVTPDKCTLFDKLFQHCVQQKL